MKPKKQTKILQGEPLIRSAELKLMQRPLLAPHWEGALWKILACLCFAAVNAVVRYLNGGAGGIENPLPPYEIVFLQNFFGCFLMIPWVLKKGFVSLKTKWPGLNLVRVIAAVLGVILWYFSLYYMPVAKAVALAFTGPIFTIIGAKLYLSERVGIQRMIAILLAFTGTFIIMRPDRVLAAEAEFDWTVLLPLLSAIFIAVSKLTARHLGMLGESPRVITTYLLFLMVPISFLPALYGWVMPNTGQWLALIALGVLGTLAHLSTAKALSMAEVTFLNPFGFSRLIFSTLIAYLAFGEMPKASGFWIGVSVLVGSLFLMSLDSRYRLRNNGAAVEI